MDIGMQKTLNYIAKLQNLKAIHNTDGGKIWTLLLNYIAKLQNLKAIHNTVLIEYNGVLAELYRKITKFESNSQRYVCFEKMRNYRFCIHDKIKGISRNSYTSPLIV